MNYNRKEDCNLCKSDCEYKQTLFTSTHRGNVFAQFYRHNLIDGVEPAIGLPAGFPFCSFPSTCRIDTGCSGFLNSSMTGLPKNPVANPPRGALFTANKVQTLSMSI